MRANLILKSFACLAVAGMIAGCGGQKKKEEAAKAEQARLDSLKQEEMIQKQKAAGDLAARLPEEPIFDIVTNLGTIKVKLYSKTPKHRANFEKLAISGYFDSLLFHRVIDGFMIQGGDPYTRDTSMVENMVRAARDILFRLSLCLSTSTSKAHWRLQDVVTRPIRPRSLQVPSSISCRTRRHARSSTARTRYSARRWTGSMSLTKLQQWRLTDATAR